MNHHYNTSVILPIVILVFILFMNCAGAATWTVDPTPGVGNYTTVQAAINAAAVGDTILVQSGTYYEHVVVNKQLILQGVDSGSGLPVIDGNASGSAITLSANNCILENFSAVNSGSNYMGIYVTSSGNTISNNNASGNGYGIYLDSSSSNTVSGNTANGNGFYGIFLITSSNNAVSDNIATGNIRDGIHLTSSSIGNTVSGNAASGNIWQGIILISSGSNAILGNTASNNSKDGIQIYSSSGNAVSGNIANGNSLNGIEFYQSNGNDISYNSATGNVQAGIQLGSSSNNAISGNTANGNSLNGIDFYQSSGNDISDNAATDNLQAGIQLDTSSNNNTVTSNIASSNSGQGIWLASSTGNTVSDNSANNNHYGIWLSSSAENTISGNTATGNIPYGIVLSSSSASNIVSGNTATGNTQHGILLDFSTANNITGNNVANNSGSGFYLSSSTSNAISGNTIASNGRGIRTSSSPSNTISDNTITNSSYDGIYLVSSNSNNVSDNNVTGNSRHGICLLSLTGCIVSGNTVGSNKEDGIRLESSSSSTLSGNDANSNAKYGIQLKYSNSNSISGNTASGNSLYGIYLDSSSSNTIYLNAFDNTNNGWSNGANHWNATSSQTYEQGGQNLTGLLGNIWSDYDGIDCDGDGVGETPYDISGGSEKDYHPLGGIEASPSMEVEKRADRTEAEVGEWISYTIRVNNTGNVNLTNVRAWDNLTSTVWELGTLQPGQNYTNTTSYRVNLTDFPGPLANELWANGTSESCGGEVNDSATETVMVKYNCTYGPRTHTVCASGCNYTTIQAAINDACPGDTILVQSGTYSERVVVNKTLTLQGVGAPVVDAGGLGNAFTLTAPNCTLQGFVARNSGFNFGGIVAVSSGNTISGNTATGSRYGIHLASSSGNTIFGNTATGNIINGIDLYQSTRNNISGNTVTGNSNRGIVIYFSNGNAISGNTASGNPDSGIFLQSANSNTVMDNSATGSNYGIKLFSGGSSNNVLRNSVSGNNYGIWLESTGGSNTIYGNTATGNSQYGIYLVSSSSNTIYLNTFDNTNNAWSNGANHWNATSSQTYEQGGQNLTGLLGNIWSDYEGFDCDGDGVGDTPYDISGGSEKDYHPLGGSEAGAALAVEKIAEKSVVGIGEQINYTIWVNNTGNVTLNGVRAEDNLTGSVWTVGTLVPGQNYTNTTSYQMNASDLPGPLINELQANGTDPCGGEVNDSAIETVNITGHGLLCISGYKLDDCTGDGLLDWEIILEDRFGTEITRTRTNDTGYYQFCGLAPGYYRLNETLKDGWIAVSAPGNFSAQCENVSNLNFTNRKKLCIKGWKWDNSTGQGLPGWTIELKDSTGAVIKSTVTNASAFYEFCELEPGNYTVSEILKDGYISDNGKTSIDVELICENLECNFFNHKKPCIKGANRGNCTGNGLANWTIELRDETGLVINTTETDSNGDYSFCNLEAGNYTVCELLQGGWKNVTPLCILVTLDTENSEDNNFVNDPPICIGGTKINGLTGNPLEGCYINLTAENGTVIGFTTTDADGRYSFCGLEPGNYTVCEFMPGSWKNAADRCVDVELGCEGKIVNFQNIPSAFCINGSKINNCTGEGLANWTIELRDYTGAVIDSTETDASGDYSFCSLESGNYTVCELLQDGWKNVTPSCIPVTLDTDSSEDIDFANDPPICISGRKINDCTEEGIPGWKITLYDALGEVIGTAITDANGRYSFCKLDPGIYYVCEEKREGWTAVPHKSQADLPSTTPITCNSPWCDDNCVCVRVDCEGAEVDFRNIQETLCIKGTNINNCTGAGLLGWSIYLYDATGKNIATTQTDSLGRYSFCNLSPGQYRVCEEIRDGWVPVTYLNHSNATCLPEQCTCDVCNNCIPVILDCVNSEDNDFENIPPLSIKGKVIDDCTGLGLKGWTVKLSGGGIATPISTTTKADGSYEFKSSASLKLTAGTLYSVCEVLKDGYTPVTYHANNTSRSASPVYCIPIFLDCGETVVDDFENIPPLLISGHELNHCTGAGLDGWIINLKDGAGNILESTTTDDTGYYEFSGLNPGWYTVCEDSIPEGWTSFRDDPNSPAMALPGTSGAPEDCETPKCIVVNLDYCEDGTDNDFENIPSFCINGTVYNNSTEVAGFPVKIENSDGTQILSIPTNANGEYSFCGLKAGTYTVCVDKPGWTADKPCVVVYLDCMDEEQDFDVYKGRSNVLPGIEQPAITFDDTSGAVVEGNRSGEPEKTGDDSGVMVIEPAARETLNPQMT